MAVDWTSVFRLMCVSRESGCHVESVLILFCRRRSRNRLGAQKRKEVREKSLFKGRSAVKIQSTKRQQMSSRPVA